MPVLKARGHTEYDRPYLTCMPYHTYCFLMKHQLSESIPVADMRQFATSRIIYNFWEKQSLKCKYLNCSFIP